MKKFMTAYLVPWTILVGLMAATGFPASVVSAADCEDRCDLRYERCYEKCEDLDGNRWSRCADQCDADNDNCAIECTSRSATGSRALTGEDGCYFGECNSQASEPATQPPVQPQPTQTLPQAQPRQFPQQPAVATFCITAYGSCLMAISIPVGSVCSCYTYMGEIPGIAQ